MLWCVVLCRFVLYCVVMHCIAFFCVVFCPQLEYSRKILSVACLTFAGVHSAVWILTFISFIFLYPSTFNLLEIAAVEKPKLHMWETGIMRITRHPQFVGQGLWCIAHTAWIGSSFAVVTSIGLMAHHTFGVWHGDRRLFAKYGEAFEEVWRGSGVTLDRRGIVHCAHV